MVVCLVEYDKTTDKATDRVTKGVDDEVWERRIYGGVLRVKKNNVLSLYC